MGIKGSWSRVRNKKAWDENWEKAFGKKGKKDEGQKEDKENPKSN